VAGRRGVRATAAVTFGGLTGHADGTITGAGLGHGVIVFGPLTGTAVGKRGVFGTVAGPFGTLTGLVVGTRKVTGTAVASLGTLTGHTTVVGTGRRGVGQMLAGALLGQAVGRRGVVGAGQAGFGFVGLVDSRAIDGWVCLVEGPAWQVVLVERAPWATLGEQIAATVTLTIDTEC
jgi:hypothetical protein